jgi:hypothetical protein
MEPHNRHPLLTLRREEIRTVNDGVNPKNETVKEDTLCRKGNCEWQRDGILNIFDRWQWSE